MQLKKRQVMNKQLAQTWLTKAEHLRRREGAEQSSALAAWRPGAQDGSVLAALEPAALAGWREAGAKPRCNVSLLNSLVRSAVAFTAFQVFLNHLQKQD